MDYYFNLTNYKEDACLILPIILDKTSKNGVMKLFIKFNPGIGEFEELLDRMKEQKYMYVDVKKGNVKLSVCFLGVFNNKSGFPILPDVLHQLRKVLIEKLSKCRHVVLVKMCGKKWQQIKEFAESVQVFQNKGEIVFCE